MSAETPIEARGLTKRYGELVAVDAVDLTVEPGDVFGYLGPNGAGKTTSLRMMLGLIRPSAGSVRLFGRDPQAGVAALDGVAGFVEEPRFYPYLTGRRNLELCASLDGHGAAGRIDEVLDVVELSDRARDRVGGYSHGMRQRLGIAAALLRRPRLLLVDEPATGLDPAGMRDMRLLIRRLADDGMTCPALEPPPRRGGGAVQPRRDRAQGQRRIRGRALGPPARRRVQLPAADDRRRAGRARRRGAARGSRTSIRASTAAWGCARPPTTRSASSRARWSSRAR
jgi:ABC-type Na+ transport system ATPase subunit NatA